MHFLEPAWLPVQVNPILTLNTLPNRGEAAIAGPDHQCAGLYCPKPYVEAGQLVRVLEHVTLPSASLRAVPLAPLSGMKVKAFIDFMIEEPGPIHRSGCGEGSDALISSPLAVLPLDTCRPVNRPSHYERFHELSYAY